MIHGLAALGKLDDFVWTPKVLIRDQVIRSCIMNNDDSQTFKNMYYRHQSPKYENGF